MKYMYIYLHYNFICYTLLLCFIATIDIDGVSSTKGLDKNDYTHQIQLFVKKDHIWYLKHKLSFILSIDYNSSAVVNLKLDCHPLNL